MEHSEKSGLFLLHSKSKDLFTFWLVSACSGLLFHILSLNIPASLFSWEYNYFEAFCFAQNCIFELLKCLSPVSLFLKLLLHAWKKQIKYVDYRAFYSGGLCCLIPQDSEQSDRLLLQSSQWTKPWTQTHNCLLMSLEKIDPFTKMPFMLWRGHRCSTQTDVHRNTHTRHTFSRKPSAQSFFCLSRLEKSSPLMHVMYSSSSGSAADIHTAMLHYKRQKEIWQQNFLWNMRDFRD